MSIGNDRYPSLYTNYKNV